MGLCSMSERTGGSIPLSTLPFVRISMARRPHHDIAQSGCPYIHGVSSGVYQRASWYFVIEGTSQVSAGIYPQVDNHCTCWLAETAERQCPEGTVNEISESMIHAVDTALLGYLGRQNAIEVRDPTLDNGNSQEAAFQMFAEARSPWPAARGPVSSVP